MAKIDDLEDNCDTLSGTINTGFTINLGEFNTCSSCGHCKKSEPCKHCGVSTHHCEKLGIDVEPDFFCKYHTMGQTKQAYPYTPTIPYIPWKIDPCTRPISPTWICDDNNSVTIQDSKKTVTNKVE